MGREPGDPRGAGLPPAGQERCHSLFAAPLGLGGPSGSLPSRRGLCLSASLSHPAQQSCSSVLGPPACHLPRGPGPGGRVWGRDRAAGARRKRQASHRHGKAWALFLVQGTRADGVRPALQKTALVPDAKDTALLRRPRTPGAEGRSFPRASGYAFTPQRASEPLDPRASCRGDRRAVGGKATSSAPGPVRWAPGVCVPPSTAENRGFGRAGPVGTPGSPHRPPSLEEVCLTTREQPVTVRRVGTALLKTPRHPDLGDGEAPALLGHVLASAGHGGRTVGQQLVSPRPARSGVACWGAACPAPSLTPGRACSPRLPSAPQGEDPGGLGLAVSRHPRGEQTSARAREVPGARRTDACRPSGGAVQAAAPHPPVPHRASAGI